ncbi:MAG: polar amino acid transport system substrate-binding protein [bacterium]|jgi:polar amino acid transport system substrate-binding protein
MSARRAAAALLCCLAAAAAGCADVSERAQRSSLAALRRQEPAPRPEMSYGSPTPACLRHEFRSLAPGTLPRPGRMAPGSFMREIEQRRNRKLVVGVDQNTLRLGYFDPARKAMRGFDISLAREVARAIFGANPDDHILFKAVTTSQRAAAIVKGEVDIVASAYTITCRRRTRMSFSSVYYVARMRLLVPAGSGVSKLDDLRGRRVCATSGSTSWDRLAGTGVIRYPVSLRADCLVALEQAKVDAIGSDDAILLGLQDQNPQTRIVGPSLRCERYGMAINRDHPEFVRFVNAVLARLRARGTLAAFRNRWLGDDLPPLKGGRACQ